MQIILNSNLVKIQNHHTHKNYVGTILNRLNKNGLKHTYLGGTIHPDTETQLGFLELLSRSYSNHEKIEIAPHDIWYIVLSEIAIIIKNNSEQCRKLFTRSDSKVNISVPVHDVTQIDLDLVVDQLKRLIPVDVKLFIPELSTATSEAKLALYTALCDGVSTYYNYSTFACGIPEIRLLGTLNDWEKLADNTTKISKLFASVNLSSAIKYLDRVSQILNNICQSFVLDNRNFWLDIFTQRNIGSGGELEINGWITKLYFETRELRKIQNFLNANTIVSYENIETGRKFKGVYGAFESLRTSDDFLQAGYASLIFEEIA